MALSRIWSAFIIIAILVAVIRVVATDNKSIFSAMVTGKTGDTIRLKKQDSSFLSLSQLAVLDSNKIIANDDVSVIRTPDRNLQYFRIQSADGLIQTCKS